MKSLQEYLMEGNELNMDMAHSIWNALRPVYMEHIKYIAENFKLEGSVKNSIKFYGDGTGILDPKREKLFEKIVKEYWSTLLKIFQTEYGVDSKIPMLQNTLEILAKNPTDKGWSYTNSGRVDLLEVFCTYYHPELDKIDHKLQDLMDGDPQAECFHFGTDFLADKIKLENKKRVKCEFGTILFGEYLAFRSTGSGLVMPINFIPKRKK